MMPRRQSDFLVTCNSILCVSTIIIITNVLIIRKSTRFWPFLMPVLLPKSQLFVRTVTQFELCKQHKFNVLTSSHHSQLLLLLSPRPQQPKLFTTTVSFYQTRSFTCFLCYRIKYLCCQRFCEMRNNAHHFKYVEPWRRRRRLFS